MNEMVETRELIMLDGHGVIIRGTYHKAHDDNPDTQLNLLRRDRVGVVFLNGLTATRAGHGDAVVYWADSLAERGYPSFRLDLPGHGDSEGDPPTEWLGLINMGGYASIASATIRELVGRSHSWTVLRRSICNLYRSSYQRVRGASVVRPLLPLNSVNKSAGSGTVAPLGPPEPSGRSFEKDLWASERDLSFLSRKRAPGECECPPPSLLEGSGIFRSSNPHPQGAERES
jgi:hypothetical protein